MRHSSLVAIEWQDLCQLRRSQVLYNILLPLPFLCLSWLCAAQAWWLPALLAAFLFFTAALRQAHDAYHRTLGVNNVTNELILLLLSVTMLCSTHAIRRTHLNHHQDPLGKGDVEGNWARLPWYQAVIGGAWFSVRIQWFGLCHGRLQQRILVVVDFLLISAVLIIAAITQHPIMLYHVLVMLLANTLVGFFAVWSVHHDCDATVYARSERRPLINMLTFNLLYHIEHHLFPAVPTNHLPILAQRLESRAPQWTNQPVLPRRRDIKTAQKSALFTISLCSDHTAPSNVRQQKLDKQK